MGRETISQRNLREERLWSAQVSKRSAIVAAETSGISNANALRTQMTRPTTMIAEDSWTAAPAKPALRRSPTIGLLLGLVITLAAVAADSWYTTRQISRLRSLQTDLTDRNR